MLSKLLTNKSADIIFRFLTLHRDSSFFDKEISVETGLSRGVTNQILNGFLVAGVVLRERRGRMWFYSLTRTPLTEYFRIYDNLVALNDLVNELKPLTQRIILFGSAANGSDTAESDIDLFIISSKKSEVLSKIRNFIIDREVTPIVLSPLEFATARSKDKPFYDQVEHGLRLYEEDADEQSL